MDPERWRRVRAVMQDAVALPPSERPAFLDHACPDADDRREAESLLAEHDRGSGFLEEGIGAIAASLLSHVENRLEPGRVVGNCRIVREIGHGGMGVVYLARDLTLGRDVALKVLLEDPGQDNARRERLRREARAAAAVSHAGVAQVYALEEDREGFTYIVTEFVDGRTLREEIGAGPLPAPRAIATAHAIACALAAAHGRGVIHRDLKPENVMRSKDGAVKVLDFGLAHLDQDDGETRLTRAGTVMGTPGYISPEQLMGEDAGPASDIYALGLVLHEMLTGKHAFSGSTNSARTLMARVLQSEPNALPDSVVAERPGIDAVVARCLARRPDERFISMSAVAASLERLIRPAATTQVVTPSSPPSTAWWQRHHLIVSGLYIAMIFPVWLNRGEPLPRWGHNALVLAVILAAALAATLRLHVVFTARVQPAHLPPARRRAQPWIRGADWLMTLILLAAAGAALLRDRVWFAALFFAVAASATIASQLIEPATTEATFGKART